AFGTFRLSVRQRDGQAQRARPREPADPCRRRRRRHHPRRASHQVRGTDAAGESPPDAARKGRRPSRRLRRQHRQGRGAAVAVRRVSRPYARRAEPMMRTVAFGVSVAAVLLSTVGAVGAGPNAALADAAEKMDRAAIRALLQQRADGNAPQADGMTALHWAAYQDDLGTVDVLVRAGANVKAVNRYGVTPLSLACTSGNGAVVERLLAAGADPNAALPGGETPLMTASRVGSLASVKALLVRGANVRGKDDRREQTALMWAAAEGHADVAQVLVEVGADLRARLASGFTPLLFAVREGRADVVRVLLKAGADVNETIPADGARRRGYGGRLPPAGARALLLAATNAPYELASDLLDAGADPNAHLTGHTAPHAHTPGPQPGRVR